MTPVFLIVGNYFEETNELIQQILDYLQTSIFPLLYEIRGLLADGGSAEITTVIGDTPLMVVLLFGLGFLSGVQLFRVFAARLGRGVD